MHRVERLEQRDDTTLMWHENIWGIRRSWESEITDQVPCEKIAWRSKSGPQSIGLVTFHELADRLTRIYVTMDFQPQGLFEKTTSGMRLSRRALKSDLMRFKAYAELEDAPTGGWFGTIEDGEVVDDGSEQGEDQDTEASGEDQDTEAGAEDDSEDQEETEDEPVAEEDEAEEPEAEEPEASEEGDFADEDEEESDDEPSGSADEEEEPEEEPAPPPRPRRRRRTATASGRSRG
jgi:hypothetical protein